jgi:FtsZ-binding cell division protein ZapB
LDTAEEGPGKQEIGRANEVIKEMITRVQALEIEISKLQEKRNSIAAEFPLYREDENLVYERGWRYGFAAGF